MGYLGRYEGSESVRLFLLSLLFSCCMVFGRFWYRLWPFSSQKGHGFCALVVNCVYFLYEGLATFSSSLSMRPSTKARHNQS